MSIFAAPSFYNQADQNIFNQGDRFVTQQPYRLGDPIPLSTGTETTGAATGINTVPINNMRSGSGGITGIGGNAFGYGSALDPVSYGQYGAPGYTGGLEGGVQQFGVGRQFEDPSASPIGETYSYKKTVPAFARIAAGFIPFGNTALNFIENKMNNNRDQPSGNYAIGGLDDFSKGAYNQLAGQGLLFSGPSGVKTATGKNFGAKGYFEGQKEIFDNLTNKGFSMNQNGDVIDDEGNIVTGFKALQFKEAATVQNYQKYQYQQQQKEIQKELEAAAKAKNKAAALAAIKKQGKADYNPEIHGPVNYGKDSEGNQSFDSGMGFGIGSDGGPVSNQTGRGRQGYMGGGLADLVDIYD